MMRLFRVQGHSMEPRIKNGQRVVTVPFFRYRVGDVVTAKSRGKIFVKRIAVKESKGYTLRGDNHRDSTNPEPVARRDILGRVILVF